MKLELCKPDEIEKRSFEIIESELPHPLDPLFAPIILRVIHTTADFDYADSLCFSEKALKTGLAALKAGERIVTDTNMAKAGINTNCEAQVGYGVENFKSLQNRAYAALCELCEKESGPVLVAAHGTWLRALLCKILHISIRYRDGFMLDNAGVSVLGYDDLPFKVITLNALL